MDARRERQRDATKRWRSKNIEATRAYSRIHMRGISKEQKRIWNTPYRERNRILLNTRARARYANSLARQIACKNSVKRRKVRLRGASGIIRDLDRIAVFDRDNGICHLCGMLADKMAFHLDHVIPVSKGGAHTLENVAVSHPLCNRRKGNRYANRQTQTTQYETVSKDDSQRSV